MQGTKEETIKTILNKNNSKIDIDINSFIFKYGTEIINIDKKFDDIANEIDQKFSGITLYAFPNRRLMVNFTLNNYRQFRTECSFEDSIRKICLIYCDTTRKKMNNCLFKFGLRDINLDQTFNQLLHKNKEINENNEILSVNEPINKKNNYKEIEIKVYEKESFFQKNMIKIIIIALIILCVIIIAIILIVVLKKKPDSKDFDNSTDTTELTQKPSVKITQEPTTKDTKKICEQGYFIPEDDETLEDCIKCSLEGCIECTGTYENNECINCGDLESIYKDGKIIKCKTICETGEEEKCLTCMDNSNKCKSCNIGYKLIDGKCRPDFYIKAVYKVNAEGDNIDLFSSNCKTAISHLYIEGKNITLNGLDYTFKNAGNQTVYFQFKKSTYSSNSRAF